MESFHHAFMVRSPHSAVAEFHQDPHALRRLTPPLIRLVFLRPEPLAEGSISEFTMWFGPIPIRWVAEHVQVDPQTGFTDRQLEGPMRTWRDTHRFDSFGKDETQTHDHIELDHFAGERGLLTRTLFSRPALHVLFAFRQAQTRHALETRRVAKDPET